MSITLQRHISGVVATGLLCLAAMLIVPAWLIHSNDRHEIAMLRENLLRTQWQEVMDISRERLTLIAAAGTNPSIRRQDLFERAALNAPANSSNNDWLPHNRLRRAQVNGQISSWLVRAGDGPNELLIATATERDDGAFTVLSAPAALIQTIASKAFGLHWRVVDQLGRVLVGSQDAFAGLPNAVYEQHDRASVDLVRIDGESFHPVSILLSDINDQPIGWLQVLRPVEPVRLQTEAWMAAVLILIVLITALFAGWLATAIRHTSSPLSQLAHAIRGLAAGDTFVAIPAGHGQVEVDNIASAVEVFRDHARSLEQLEFEASLARLGERKLLAAQLSRLAGVLDEQARQDLESHPVDDVESSRSPGSGIGSEGTLPRALRQMTDRIITQQNHLSTLLAERTADLEIVRQALAERTHLNRLREEISIARDLQLTYLPDTADAEALRPQIDLHAVMRPAKEVGGDVYDFRRLDDQRLLLIVGDASGKGIPAAMYILMCRILLQTAAGILASPAQALKVANNALSRDNEAMVFTTVFLAILNVQTGELTYTNAGHNRPLLRRANGTVEALEGAHGVLMGVAEGFDYQEETSRLEPGDALLLYTDGVTEAHAPDDTLFGEARLVDSFAKQDASSSAEAVQALLAAVDDFSAGREQSDDITLTVLRRPRV